LRRHQPSPERSQGTAAGSIAGDRRTIVVRGRFDRRESRLAGGRSPAGPQPSPVAVVAGSTGVGALPDDR